MKSMMDQSKLFDPDRQINSFNISAIAFVQDTIHAVLKLRNKMINPTIVLPMGDRQVSVAHLKMLIYNHPKSIHGLVLSDVCPDDHQNFGSFEKVMEEKVLEALAQNVPGSSATILFLKISQEISSSYMDCTLSPTERVYRIMHALYFLRIWRKWIIKNKNFTLKDNFITLNAYLCVEINAYYLIHLIFKFREEKEKEQFLVHLFSSQTCESTFRQMRSLSTINWTKVNFSLLELFHSIGRVEILTDIVYNKLADVEIIFPRVTDKVGKITVFELPSNEELQEAIDRAKQSAIIDAKNFGMEINNVDDIRCEYVTNIKQKKKSDKNLDANDSNEIDLLDDSLQNLKIDRPNSSEENPTSFVEVSGKKVRKSSVVSLLSTGKTTLSNDRLRRVQNQSESSRKHLNFLDGKPKSIIHQSKYLCIGDWCVFHTIEKKKNYETVVDRVVVGVVIGFQRISTGKAQWQRKYDGDYIDVTDENLEVLSSWHKFNLDGSLSKVVGNNHFYIGNEFYLATLKGPEDNTESDIHFKHLDLIIRELELINQKPD